MKATLRIIAVAPLYPTPRRPYSGVFIKSFLAALASGGHRINVIAPLPLWQAIEGSLLSTSDEKRIDEISNLVTQRPVYPTFSTRLLPWCDMGERLTSMAFRSAVRRALNEMDPPDLLYGHFFSSAIGAVDWYRDHGVDFLLTLGESRIDRIVRVHGRAFVQQTLESCIGIICVSEEIAAYCRYIAPSAKDKIVHIPNGVDTTLFCPKKKTASRKHLGLDQRGKLAAFTGHFIERKGPRRVVAALERLDNIKGIFLGSGSQVPHGEVVKFAGQVWHDAIPLWLTAADVFVLPSLAEGMSNAILEALACGIPVVVADRSFNRTFLDERYARFVDPLDPEDIARGIKSCIEDPDRHQAMARAAVVRADELSTKRRMDRVIEFALDMKRTAHAP
jgi:glycosyltransferase involved in cell wall biosynthesis